jgi:hypothetical protein
LGEDPDWVITFKGERVINWEFTALMRLVGVTF